MRAVWRLTEKKMRISRPVFMLSTEGRGKGYGTLYLTSEVALLSREYSPRKPMMRSFYRPTPLYASVLRFKGM